MRHILIPLVILTVLSVGCKKEKPVRRLIVFHAGSLSMPFRKIATEFELASPGVRVLLEAAGSRVCARKISELNRRADVMASADLSVIDTLLIPRYAAFSIPFAGNEMVIAYGDKSRRAEAVNSGNWYTILLEKGVSFGRSNPDADPCGYRTVMVAKLAEKHYRVPGLAAKLLAKDTQNIRPKETDLLALLEAGQIDYLFIYKSVAVQHGLRFVSLPVEINLRDRAHAASYGAVSAKVSGKKPGTTIRKVGAPMVYGITIPRNAPNRELAERFVAFVLHRDGGMRILEAMGQTSLVPSPTPTYDKLPASLKPFAKAPPR